MIKTCDKITWDRTYLPSKSVFLVFVLFIFYKGSAIAQTVALPTAFAHNDYRHKHPVYDALSNGFTHLESDIFLKKGRLLVLHTFPFFKGSRTLETLYFKPLSLYIASRQNSVQTAMDTLVLMIDVKSDGEKTFTVLKELLDKYKDMLSYYEDGKVIKRNLTIVLSGHRPLQVFREEQTRYFFVDENLSLVNRDEVFNNMYTMASCRYAKLLKWKGKGPMPDPERKRLCDIVSKAHEFGKKVRLWASPENEKVWTELLNCGVDLINTDKLDAFRRFSTNNMANTTIASTEDSDLWIP